MLVFVVAELIGQEDRGPAVDGEECDLAVGGIHFLDAALPLERHVVVALGLVILRQNDCTPLGESDVFDSLPLADHWK